ncbi:MAG: response regulator [Phycisphaerales bacterium]|nr:response regulator [Phycisphaerales bacterium]
MFKPAPTLREGQTADLANHTALIARNGTEYQIAHSCAPIRDDGGTIIGAVLVFRDVTEEYCRREELAEERQRIEHILSVTKTGINITDPQFNLRYVDPAWQKIYGNPAGRKCYEYFMRLDRPCPGCGIPQALATKQPVVSEEVLPLENNRTVEVHTIPFQDSNGQWLVAEFNVDITERKRTEESLLETNRRLTEATAEAKSMAVQAKLANAAKSEFLANMSHEIRTPMTAILGYADLIGECCPGQCAYGREEMRKGIGTVQRNGRHLLEIINNILDLSKIEADKMTVEMVPVSPHAIVAEVESLVRVRAEANNLAFNCEFLGPVPETIRTDPLRVRQILVNLLGNSIKFTDTGGIRLLVCMVDEDSKPCLQFDVLDTGIGMTAEQAQNIFQPFSQVDNSMTRRFGGTGLGLTISKRLAQMLGGDVFLLHSQPGLGTRFRLILPIGPLADIRMIEGNDNAEALVVQREQGPAILSPVAGDKTLNGLRILLAEDSPDNQRLISFVLKKSGACITTVDNGRMAVDTALAQRDTGKPFDIILMDMQMPIMDGYMAATTLRGQGYAGPIIALTAHAMASDRKKCIDAGCDEYVTKPIDRSRLIEVIVSTRNEASLLPTTSITSQPTQDAYP